MLNHDKIEQQLNVEVKKILLLIKSDYYTRMSEDKKKVLDDLLKTDKVVIVGKGAGPFHDNTLAHGGRALKDGKIHFYPDVREFKSDDEAISACKKILPHECFHYFIQPDNIKFAGKNEKEMANFYTEGIVEKEARKFYERHRDEIDFEKANYGFNISFVNMIQEKVGANSYEVIFSESEYLRDIINYAEEYKMILRRQERIINIAYKISQEFPEEMRKKVFRTMRRIILQDGNPDRIKEKLKKSEFIEKDCIKELYEDEPEQ